MPTEGLEKIPSTVHYIQTKAEHNQSQNTLSGIARHVRSVRRHAWKIGAFVFGAVFVTYTVSSRLQPLYESTVTIDVDHQAPSAVIGQDSYRNSGSSSLEADQFLATQTKLIESDAVLRPVAQKYDLVRKEGELDFKLPWQRWFRHPDTPAEREQAQEAPVGLNRLKITRPPNTYLLLIRYQSNDPKLAAAVANAIAESYLRHTYEIRMRSSASLATFMEMQSAELKAKMERSSQALARMEKDLGVISSDEKTNILAARLIQLNTDYTNAQSDRLKKEAIWKSVNSGSLGALQVSGQAEQLAQLNQKLDEARQRQAEIEATYGYAHPEHRKVTAEVAELNAQITAARSDIAKRVEADYDQALGRERMFGRALEQTKAEADQVNARFFQYAQLKHEAESDKKLYEELIWKIKESVTNAGFQNNNIWIADTARPGLRPVFPKKGLNLLLAFLFSSVLAVSASCIYDALDNTAREPDQLSRLLETDVIATLPVVKRQTPIRDRKMLVPVRTPALDSENLADLVVEDGPLTILNGYPEAIRTLRNTLELSSYRSPLRSLVITSATLGEGKTTTAVNLAIAHAKHRKRTLLIDADLRDPKLHRVFKLPDSTGLSMMLMNGPPWGKPGKPIPVCSIDGHPDLYVIPAGSTSDRPSDIMGSRLVALVDDLRKSYDLIIIDAPPLLGFADPLELAMVADGVLMVARAGKTKVSDVALGLSQLNRIQANIIGVVLNRMTRSVGGVPYYYSYGEPKQRPNQTSKTAGVTV